MSFQAMAWAIKAGLPTAEKFVLIMLANYADEDGLCWPSVARLSDDTGLSRRTVFRKLEALEKRGIVRRRARAVDGMQTTTAYQLIAENQGCHSDTGGVSQCHGGGVTVTPGTYHSNLTEKERIRTDQPSSPSPARARDDDPSETAQVSANGKYAFEGKVARLTHADMAQWRKVYDRVDVLGEMTGIDDWLHRENIDKRRWFHAASRVLAKRQAKALELEGRTAAADPNGNGVRQAPMPGAFWMADRGLWNAGGSLFDDDGEFHGMVS